MTLNTDNCHPFSAGQNMNISRSKKVNILFGEKLLEITIDNELKFDSHISNLCSKANTKVFYVNLTFLSLQSIHLKAIFEAYFQYFFLIWMFVEEWPIKNSTNFTREL